MIKNNTYMGQALRIAVGIMMLGILLPVVGIVQATAVLPDIPQEPQMPGRLEANGMHFELNNSEYLNISLDSSEPINLTLESAPEMVTMHIESASGAASAQITLGGFLPQTTYHKYEDDYHNHTAFTTDTNGNYVYMQDLSNEHLVFIQPRPSTKFIKDNATGGDCTSFGIWDATTKTCTLTTDLSETIQIDSNGVTLDGNGHTMTGSNTGNGVYLSSRTGVTIKNLNLERFSNGIYLDHSSNNNMLSGNNASNNDIGIDLWMSSKNTMNSNNVSKNRLGMSLAYSYSNMLSGNNANSNSQIGIEMFSSSNILSGNNANSNSYYGISLSSSSNNMLNGNNASNNGKTYWFGNGICLFSSSNNNMFSGNNVSNNGPFGIYLSYSSYNTFSGNNVSKNNYGIRLDHSSNNNTLSGNNASNNIYEGIFLYSSSNNKIYHNNLIHNQAFDDSNNNLWDSGYPLGGNYWSYYPGIDNNGDGIGDTPYPIPGGSSVDKYPLMAPYTGQPPTPVNHAPDQPFELYQNKSDGTTPIATGTPTNERTVIFKGKVSDSDGDNVKLQVELRRTDEYGGNFDENQGGLKNSSLVTNGSEVSITVSDLIDGNYHWRARAIDEHETKGEWVEFGGNLVLDADFIVSTAIMNFNSQITEPENNVNIAEDSSMAPKTIVNLKGKSICNNCQEPYYFYWSVDNVDYLPRESNIGEDIFPFTFYNSGSHTVELRIVDKNGKESSISQVNFEIAINIAYIPIEFRGGSTSHKTIGELQSWSQDLKDYYYEQSYGKENLRNIVLNLQTLPNTKEDYYNQYMDKCTFDPPLSSNMIHGCEVIYLIKDMVNNDPIVKSNIEQNANNLHFSGGVDNTGFSAFVGITSEWFSEINPAAFRSSGFAVVNDNILELQHTGYGTWAHELGHAQFGLCDYYDAINKCGDIGYWGLMGKGTGYYLSTPPSDIISYNKEKVKWLEYEKVFKGDIKPIKLLDEMQPPVDKIPKYDTTEPNNCIGSYIFEKRRHLDWGSVLKPGILIYTVEKRDGKLRVIDTKSSYTTLYALWPSHSDPVEGSKFSINFWGELKISDHNPKNTNTVKLCVNGGFPTLQNNGGIADPSYTSPDINLYATNDGKTVGFNRITNDYEINIPNAEASGNVYGAGSEWITLPDNVNAEYTIDTSLVKKWTEENGVSIPNIPVDMQVIHYDENGIKTFSKAITINANLENPTIIKLSELLPINITFLPPITTMNQFTLTNGSTLPIKFTARNNTTNEFIYDGTVKVSIKNSTGYLIASLTNGTGANNVRINYIDEQYIVNLNTKNYALKVGETYAVTVTFGDAGALRGYEITYFTLVEGGKAKGKGN